MRFEFGAARDLQRPLVQNVAAFLLFLTLIVLGQWFFGAYRSEFIENADESAHYVTGLLVHDYVAASLPWPPMQFAQDFNDHYPRVALGHWPPVFYVLESAWMFLFGEGRSSILLLIASISAMWALLCLNLFQRFMGRPASWVAVIFLLSGREVFMDNRKVMTEILIAVLTLAALWALHKLFESPGWGWSVAFGCLACAAIMTKATGVLLAPLPILAVLALRRWDLLKSPWFWLPAVMVIIICAPWYAFVPFALHEKMVKYGDPRPRPYRFGGYFVYFAQQYSWAVLALAISGWGRTAVRIARKEEISPIWALAFFSMPASWAFFVIVGAWEARHLITVAPFLLLFAYVGLQWLLSITRLAAPPIYAIVAVGLLAFALQHLATVRNKPRRGLAEVADAVLSRPELKGRPLLIVSDAAGEGAFIAEVAMRDRRPNLFIQRGYKFLTTYERMGKTMKSKFAGPEALAHYLGDPPSQILIFDPASMEDVHGQMTKQMLEMQPQNWRQIFAYAPPGLQDGSLSQPIRVYLPVAIDDRRGREDHR